MKSYAGRPAQLEAYLDLCQSIEKNIDRRMASNRFNLSILTALGAIAGLVLSSEVDLDTALKAKSLSTVAFAALFVCISWVFQVLRFREVSRIKHEVAIELETRLDLEKVSLEDVKFKKSSSFVEQTISEMLLPLFIMGVLIWNLLL